MYNLPLAPISPNSEPGIGGELKFFDSLEEAQSFAEVNKDNYEHIEISISNEENKTITRYIKGEKQD